MHTLIFFLRIVFRTDADSRRVGKFLRQELLMRTDTGGATIDLPLSGASVIVAGCSLRCAVRWRVPFVAGVATDGHQSAQRGWIWNRVCVGASNRARRTVHCMHHRQIGLINCSLNYNTRYVCTYAGTGRARRR